MASIYQIRNLINNKIYIGSTIRSNYIRKYEHFSELRKGIHCNPYLQRAFNKYGEENFLFEVIEKFLFPKNFTQIHKAEYLVCREFYLISLLNADYNIRKEVTTGHTGYTHTEETKRKISLANTTLTPSICTLRKRERESRRKDGVLVSKEFDPLKENNPWVKGSKHTEASIKKIRQRSLQKDNMSRMFEFSKAGNTARRGVKVSEFIKKTTMFSKFGVNRVIEIFNKNNKLIHVCNFSPEASKLTGVKRSAISNNLSGISKSAGGLIFKYKII